MTSKRNLTLTSLSLLGVLMLSPDASALAGDRRGNSGGGGGGRSSPAPVSRPTPSPSPRSSGGGGGGGRVQSAPTPQRERPAPAPAPAPQRERPAPTPAPAPRYEPPAAPRYEPPARSEPTPRYEPAPERRDRSVDRPAPRYERPIDPTPETSGSSVDSFSRRRDSARNDSQPWQPEPRANPENGGFDRRDTGQPTGAPGGRRGSAPSGADDGARGSLGERRVFDGTRSTPSPSGNEGDSGARTPRLYDSSSGTVDLGNAGVRREPRFPSLSGSTSGVRPGLASGRTGSERDPASVGLRRLAEVDRAARANGVAPAPKVDGSSDALGGRSLDRKALLERYRERGGLSQPGVDKRDGGGLGSRGKDPGDLSSLRRSAQPADAIGRSGKDGGLGSRRGGADVGKGPVLDGSRRKQALDKGNSSVDVDHSRRIERAREQARFERLENLADRRPREFDRVTNAGRRVADATSTSVSIAIGASVGFCGGNPGWFWDPSCHANFEHNAFTGWCSTWWWGWSSWAWPCSSWSLGYWNRHWGFWWSSSCWDPWYSYRWCPYPAYYSSVIYDTYDPAPVVIYEQPVVYREVPAYEAGPAPREGSGEGVIRDVPERAIPGATSKDGGAAGRTANVYLDQGDAAWREGRYADAVHHYAKAVEFAPDEGVLHLILSDALFATGDYHYAAFSLRKALELDPGLLESTLDKHSLYPDPQAFDRQLAVLEQYVADHPIDDDARLLLAANYLFAKRPAQCSDVLQSPYASVLRESVTGKLLLDRANELR